MDQHLDKFIPTGLICLGIFYLVNLTQFIKLLPENNPDSKECFADLKTNNATDFLGSNDSMTDVSGQMRIWVENGVLLYGGAPIGTAILIFVGYRCRNNTNKEL